MIQVETEQLLGQECFYAGDYDTALNEADCLIASADTNEKRAEGWLRKVGIYFDQGLYGKSRESLNLVAEVVDDISPRLRARFYGDRAALDIKEGKTDQPWIDYQEAKHWARIANDKLCEACIGNNLARAFGRYKRFDDALIESRAAIKIAEQLDQQFWLGRFLDQKAQILLDYDQFAEAVKAGERAVEVLELHGNPVVLDEAKATYAKALVGLAGKHVELSDPLKTFKLQKTLYEILYIPLDEKLVQLALERSDGHVYKAAQLLGVKHQSVMARVQEFKLERQPKRRRGKPLTKNKSHA